MISIILVEDQAMLRESLEHTLNDQDDMTVVAALSDAADSIDAVARTQADCVLMDVCTENDSSGIVAARKIKEAHPETRVIIMTGMPEITFIEQARDAKADSFVYKNVGTSDLLSIVRSTMEGYSTYPAQKQSVFSGTAALTDIEIDILRLVCETKTRKEIAAELYLSEGRSSATFPRSWQKPATTIFFAWRSMLFQAALSCPTWTTAATPQKNKPFGVPKSGLLSRKELRNRRLSHHDSVSD